MNDEPTPPGDPGAPQPPRLGISATTASERIGVIIEAAEKAAAGIIEDAEEQARRYLLQSRQRADQIAAERTRAISELSDSLIQRAQTVKRQSDELIAALGVARTQIDDPGGMPTPLHDVDSPPPPPAPPEPPEPEPEPEPEEPPAARPVPHLQAVDPSQAAPQGGEPAEPFPADDEQTPSLSSAPEWRQPPQPAPEPPAPEPPRPDRVEPEPGWPQAAPTPGSDGAAAGTEPRPLPGSLPTHDFAGREVAAPSAGARLLATQMAVAGSSREEIEGRLRNEFGIPDAAQMLDSILGPNGGI